MAKEDLEELAKVWGMSEGEANEKLIGTAKKTLTPNVLSAIRARASKKQDDDK